MSLHRIDVRTELETGRGWRYEVAVTREAGRRERGGGEGLRAAVGTGTTEHVVTLNWADHEHWCGGARPPSKLVESVVAALLAREGESTPTGGSFVLPERFDASTARRWFPAIDDELMRQ